MSDGGVADFYPESFAVLGEGGAGELCAVVGDDLVGDPKMAHNSSEESDHGVGSDLGDGHSLHPLGEFIDGDVEVLVSTDRLGKRPQDVQPPEHERP